MSLKKDSAQLEMGPANEPEAGASAGVIHPGANVSATANANAQETGAEEEEEEEEVGSDEESNIEVDVRPLHSLIISSNIALFALIEICTVQC